MFRFAIVVTGIEVLLTIGASLVVTFSEGSDPYLTSDDLKVLKLDHANCQVRRVPRLNAEFSWDSRAILTAPSQNLAVVHMVGALPDEYNRRLESARERQLHSEGRIILINEPFPGESGFALREIDARYVRAELVRMHGNHILIVRLQRPLGERSSGKVEAPNCERTARVVQDYMLLKLGWR